MSRQLHICLIDDDDLALDALALGLRDAGFGVSTASGAAGGIDTLQKSEIDAMVTDMNMPGVGGAYLIAQARAGWPRLPIVAISGVETRAIEWFKNLGADEVLFKPFRADILTAALDRAFAAHVAS